MPPYCTTRLRFGAYLGLQLDIAIEQQGYFSLRPAATTAITAPANSRLDTSSASPSSTAAPSKVKNGCSNWVWPTRATPPSAMPRYQKKKPINMENMEI